MRSSTSIELKFDKVGEEKMDILFDILSDISSEWLDRDNWNIIDNDDTITMYIDESGIEQYEAESLVSTVIDGFFRPYLAGSPFYIGVYYEQINGDGSCRYTADYRNGACTYTVENEIVDGIICCDDCGAVFDTNGNLVEEDEDYDEDYEEYDDEDEEEYSDEEVTLTCPNCGTEYVKRGHFVITTRTDIF